jgi:NitT/TauT family transport system ATP-binding protein
VDEALFLADRIIFMQPKKIRKDISINFGSHRVRSEIVGSVKYMELRNQLISLFYEEVGEVIGGEEVYL